MHILNDLLISYILRLEACALKPDPMVSILTLYILCTFTKLFFQCCRSLGLTLVECAMGEYPYNASEGPLQLMIQVKMLPDLVTFVSIAM